METLVQKLHANTLTNNEYLTQADIEQALHILELDKIGAEVVPLNAEKIGLILHKQREQHLGATAFYTIPLIVEVEEYDKDLNPTKHWASVVVRVDPGVNPEDITVMYNDVFDGNIKNIEKILNNAVHYHHSTGNYNSHDRTAITAFPGCTATIDVKFAHDKKNHASFSGYSALQILFWQIGGSTQNDLSQQLRRISSSSSGGIREFIIYNLILAMSEFKPQHIEGYLLALRDRKPQMNPMEYEQLAIRRTNALVLVEDMCRQVDANQALKIDIQSLDKEQLQIQFDALRYLSMYRKNMSINITINIQDGLADDAAVLQPYLNDLPMNVHIIDVTKQTPKIVSDAQGLRENINYLLNNGAANHPASSNNDVMKSEFWHDQYNPEADCWTQLFQSLLIKRLKNKTIGQFEWFVGDDESAVINDKMRKLGIYGFIKFLEHLHNNPQPLLGYHTFSYTAGPSKDMLEALSKYILTNSVPFKSFVFKLSGEDSVGALLGNIHNILEQGPKCGIESLEIQTDTIITDAVLLALINFVQNKKITTMIIFSGEHNVALLKQLENAVLFNIRQAAELNQSMLPQENSKPPILGPITNVLLHGVKEAAFNIQQQQQEQEQEQEQEQQIQSEQNSDDNNDEPHKEYFAEYSGNVADLLTRDIIDNDPADWTQRLPPESPFYNYTNAQLWDLIVGQYAGLLQYGIHSMTRSAFMLLLDNLDAVRFGLHPDNLPQGFFLQKIDRNSVTRVLLNYNALQSVDNNKKSDLTIKFTKPLPASIWRGDALQFITPAQATMLAESIKPQNKYNKDNFFGLKDKSLSIEKRRLVLQTFISGRSDAATAAKIDQQITDVFGKSLSGQNISALSEIFYQQGPGALSRFLQDVQDLKAFHAHNENFFADFKACFIDTSLNLNELTTEESRAQIEVLKAFSTQQAVWWQTLTKQHTKQGMDARRWAPFADLAKGFSYFCSRLAEPSMNLTLPNYCNLEHVKDLRVGLDRLLTILENASNKNEQFYMYLNNISLDSVDAFYASRYSGLKMVSDQMELNIHDAIPTRDHLQTQWREYRATLDNLYLDRNGLSATTDAVKAIFLRAIATKVKRAHLARYMQVYDNIKKELDVWLLAVREEFPDRSDELYVNALQALLNIIVVFGTGNEHANTFSDVDVMRLVKIFTDQQHKVSGSGLEIDPGLEIDHRIAALHALKLLHFNTASDSKNIPLTMARFCDFYQQLADTKEPYICISNIAYLKQQYGAAYSYHYIQALLHDKLSEAMQEDLYNIEHTIADPRSSCKSKQLPLELRAKAAQVLIVCSDIHNIEPLLLPYMNISSLYDALADLYTKHGKKITDSLITLLSHISSANAEEPKVFSLVTLIQTVTAATFDPNDYYDALEQHVKSKLPEKCIIANEAMHTVAPQSAGDIEVLISKHMTAIISDLSQYAAVMDRIFDGGLASLRKPEGPKILLEKLHSLGELDAGFLNDMVTKQIKAVMLNIYISVREDGIKRLDIKNSVAVHNLTKFIQDIPNTMSELEFQDFTQQYPEKLEKFEALLANLQIIKDKWPTSFNSIVALLNSDHVKEYDLELLTKLTQVWANNFDKNQVFPLDIFQQCCTFDHPDQLNGIIDQSLAILQNDPVNIQQQKIFQICIKIGANTLAESLQELKPTELEYLIQCKLLDNDKVALMQKVFKLDNAKEILGFFQKNHCLDDLLDLMSKILF